MPESVTLADRLAEKMAAWARKINGPRVSLHGDYYDKQVLFDGSKISIIDCDNAHFGHPLTDIGCYLAHLERHAHSPGGDGYENLRTLTCSDLWQSRCFNYCTTRSGIGIRTGRPPR